MCWVMWINIIMSISRMIGSLTFYIQIAAQNVRER